MGVRPARKPNKLGKMPIRIAIGTAAFCAGLALLHRLWLPPTLKQGGLQASSTVVVTTNDGLPSPSSSIQMDSPGTFSSSSSSGVVQEEMVDSLGDHSGDVVIKTLSSDLLIDQRGQKHVKDEELHKKDEQDKEIDEAEKEKDGSQKEDKEDEDELRRFEEENNKRLMNGVWKEGEEEDDDDYDDDFLSGEWEDAKEEDDDEKDEEEEDTDDWDKEKEVDNTVKGDIASASNFVTEASIVEEEKEKAILSLAECRTNYGERRFLHEDEKALPPILYSFPGSGNTWTRLLIDFSTGIYTGTIFAKPKNKPEKTKLPGQGYCNHMVSAIKAHPNQISPEELFTVPPSDPRIGRCNSLGNITSFDRFILLTRNPFDAIWSEYRRTANDVHYILRDDFDSSQFAHTVVSKSSNEYRDMVLSFRKIRRKFPKGIFRIQYEEMLDPDMRLSILSRLVKFIGINKNEKAEKMRQRLQCAFVLAEEEGGGRRADRVEQKVDVDQIVTLNEAYPPKVACRMWDIFGAEAKTLGYTLPNGIMEEECEKM